MSCAGCSAFAIWDAEQGSLFVARDPYGIKPLYYSDDGQTFRFASQVRALLAGGAVSRDPDPAGQVGFYLFGSVPEPFTSYREIRALPSGATLTVYRAGTREVRRYHSIAKNYCDAEAQIRNQNLASEEQSHADIREVLLDSVRHHLVADVPVGAFLSAGIDSGALVGLMRDVTQQDIQTVTLSFGEFNGRAEDEAPLADEVARLYGVNHTTRVVTESEFAADLPRILEAMDQPSIDGINTWFISKAAHELGLKVAVSGLGGDELFGGYPSFKKDSKMGTPACCPLTSAPPRETIAYRRPAHRRRLKHQSKSGRDARIRGHLLRRIYVAPRVIHAMGASATPRSCGCASRIGPPRTISFYRIATESSSAFASG